MAGDDNGVSLTLRTPELAQVERRLAQVVGGLKHPAPLMKIVGAVLESSTRVRFRTSISPEGAPWKPSLRVIAHGGKTLVRKARLRDSITHDADDTHAVVGSNLVYARIHQLGGKAGRKSHRVTIPARPYLGVSTSDRIEISAQIERYIERVAA
jgi:phage virion morphogenesis protein